MTKAGTRASHSRHYGEFAFPGLRQWNFAYLRQSGFRNDNAGNRVAKFGQLA
jgi:hypothetical protein